MRIRFDPEPLRKMRWHGHVVRFVAGGLVTVATGLVARAFGPVVGGVFLAVPAIFPVGLNMIERLQNREVGPGARGDRARRAALAEAAGAGTGSVGLVAFAFAAWSALARLPTVAALAIAVAAWALVSLSGWTLLRRRRSL